MCICWWNWTIYFQLNLLKLPWIFWRTCCHFFRLNMCEIVEIAVVFFSEICVKLLSIFSVNFLFTCWNCRECFVLNFCERIEIAVIFSENVLLKCSNCRECCLWNCCEIAEISVIFLCVFVVKLLNLPWLFAVNFLLNCWNFRECCMSNLS